MSIEVKSWDLYSEQLQKAKPKQQQIAIAINPRIQLKRVEKLFVDRKNQMKIKINRKK